MAFYSGTCGGDGATNDLHGYLQFSTTQKIDYVTGTIAQMKTVLACTGGGSAPRASWVLPANLQGNAFVQLGYGTDSIGNGQDWVYTPDETSSGQVVFPAGSHTAPVVGHAYKLIIQWNGTKWFYHVADTSNSTTPFSGYGIKNTRNWGNDTWYGFESYDRNSQYGGAGSSIYLGDAGYSLQGSNTVSYITNGSRIHCCGTVESWDHDGAINVSGSHTQVWAYTASHT